MKADSASLFQLLGLFAPISSSISRLSICSSAFSTNWPLLENLLFFAAPFLSMKLNIGMGCWVCSPDLFMVECSAWENNKYRRKYVQNYQLFKFQITIFELLDLVRYQIIVYRKIILNHWLWNSFRHSSTRSRVEGNRTKLKYFSFETVVVWGGG